MMARPVYERKSKLLFFQKMVNYDNSFSDHPVERKKGKRKGRTGKLKLCGRDKDNTTTQRNVCNPLKESVGMMKDFKNVPAVIESLVDEEDVEGHLFDDEVLDLDLTDKTMFCKPDNQEENINNLDVTIFAYKCQICQKGFATLSMLQEHNIVQCAEIQRQRLIQEKNCIKCNICTDLKLFKNPVTFRHHMKLFHTAFSEMDDVTKKVHVKCALCYAKRTFVYYSSLKMHLFRNHQIDVDLKECLNYAIVQDQDLGSARTREYFQVGRIHNDKQIELSSQHQQMNLTDRSSSHFIESSQKFFICRICDKPFSEFSPFLNHYRSHYSHSASPFQTNVSPTTLIQSELQSEISRTISTGKALDQDMHTDVSCGSSLTCVEHSMSNAVPTDLKSEHLHLERESVSSNKNYVDGTQIDSTNFEHVGNRVKMEPNEPTDLKNPRIIVKMEPDDVLDSEHSTNCVNMEPDDASYLENSKMRVCIEPDDYSHSWNSKINIKMESGETSDSNQSEISVGVEPDNVPYLENSKIEFDDPPDFDDSKIPRKKEPEDVSISEHSRKNLEIKPDDTPDAEHSRISVKIEGFEIELDQPSDYTANDAKQHKQLCEFYTNENEFICKMCHKSFSNYVELLCHNEVHEGKSPVKRKNHFQYSCPECNLTFSSAISYSLHIKTHGKMSLCGVCGILVESMDSLKDHIRQHRTSRQNTEVTDRKCSKTKSYQKQEKLIEKAKCRICLICSKTFLTISSYNQHMARHGIIKRPLNYAKAKAKARKHKHNYPVLEKLEIDSLDASTIVAKHTPSEQKFETNGNNLHQVSSENSVIQNASLVTERNIESSDTLPLPVEDDCNSKDVNSTACEQVNNKLHLYNNTFFKAKTELHIFNAFSLTDERFANMDSLTQNECEFGVKQEPDPQTEEQCILSDDRHFTREGFDLPDDKNLTLRGKDNQFSEIEADAGDSSDCRDKAKGKWSSHKDENMGQNTKMIQECFSETGKAVQMDMKVTDDLNLGDIISTVTNKNVVNVFSNRASKVKQNDPSSLYCEICSKSMPTLAFKRIHMLLHRKSAQFKH